MLVFTSLDRIPKARLPPHLATHVEKILTGILRAIPTYNPDNDGYLALVTPQDTDKSLGERIGIKWKEGCFEGMRYDEESRCYETLILHSNQYGISILIPDEQWLDPLIRERVNREMA